MSRPRRRFGYFAAVGKVTRRPQTGRNPPAASFHTRSKPPKNGYLKSKKIKQVMRCISMGKLFGTDGIRGVVNAGLDADLAYKVGLAGGPGPGQGQEAGRKTPGDHRQGHPHLRRPAEGVTDCGIVHGGSGRTGPGHSAHSGVAWVTVDERADAGIVHLRQPQPL